VLREAGPAWTTPGRPCMRLPSPLPLRPLGDTCCGWGAAFDVCLRSVVERACSRDESWLPAVPARVRGSIPTRDSQTLPEGLPLRSQPISRRKVLVATGLAAAMSSALLVSSVGTAHAAGSSSARAAATSSAAKPAGKPAGWKSKGYHGWKKLTNKSYRHQWRQDKAKSEAEVQAADKAVRDQLQGYIDTARANTRDEGGIPQRIIIRGRDARDPRRPVEIWIRTWNTDRVKPVSGDWVQGDVHTQAVKIYPQLGRSARQGHWLFGHPFWATKNPVRMEDLQTELGQMKYLTTTGAHHPASQFPKYDNLGMQM
jgi:hypothetical protein